MDSKGLLAQIENSNNYQLTYKELTEKVFKKFIRDLEFKNTVQPRDEKGRFIKGDRISKEREFIIWTNEEGYNEFNRSLQEEANKQLGI